MQGLQGRGPLQPGLGAVRGRWGGRGGQVDGRGSVAGGRRAQLVHAAGAVPLHHLAHTVEPHGREEAPQRQLGFALLVHHGSPVWDVWFFSPNVHNGMENI